MPIFFYSDENAKRKRAQTGRHYFIAQGASPGLFVSTHFFELRRSGTFPTNRNDTRQMLALLVPLLKELILLLPCIPRVSFRALPSLHPGLCRNVVPTALIVSLNLDTLALERQAYQKRAAAKNFATAP